jgi:DNA-binding NarL/FixJ family response regulator
LQGELERTLQQAEDGSEFQKRLSNLLDEVRRLNSITRKLLLLSLADAGRMSVHKVAIDLSQVLIEIGEDMEMLAPDLDIQIQIEMGIQVQGDRELLTQAIRLVQKGYTQLAPGLASKILTTATPANPPANFANLTPREQEILHLIAKGANNQEIADALFISEKTVRNNITNILGELGLRDRTQAAIWMHSFIKF